MSGGSYNTSDILEKVCAALEGFFERDKDLLETKASERSITHKLAEHLQREFTGWNVDCEYNRRGNRPKTMPGKLFDDIRDDEQDAKTIFPDIIVHKRNQPENLFVIEAKKSNSRESDDKDITKLKAFTDQKGEYGYRLGLFIVFDVKKKNICKVKCFENGKELKSNLPYQ